MGKGINLWQNAQGNPAVASFGGQPVPMTAFEWPGSAGAGRIRVRTAGGLRIEGWIDAGQLPLFTSAEVPIVPGHLWLAPGQRVHFSGASNGLAVEASLAGPVTQTFRATSPCSSFALDKRPRPAWDVPGNGRCYLPRGASLDLRDRPGGSVIHALQTGSGLLLWSTESQGGYVHVVYHEDLVIDAWAAASDVVALKQGETMDRLAPPSTATGSARLSMTGQPTVVRAVKDVPLRLTTQEAGKPVGFIEAGSEVYLVETVLGWTSVLPRALHILPPGDHSFWVPSSEVGAGAPDLR